MTDTVTNTAAMSLQTSLSEIIQYTVTSVKDGMDFLKDQIPDVVHQLLMWKLVSSGVSFTIYLIAFIIALVCLKKAIGHLTKYIRGEGLWQNSELPIEEQRKGKLMMKEAESSLPFVAAQGFYFIIATLAFFAGGLDRLQEILQISIAPKIYLIEYAASMVK